MKTTALFLIGAAFAITLSADVRSQANQAPVSSLQQLQLIQTENAKLIEKQTATLKRLEEMTLQAQQIKIFSRRS